MNKDFKPQILTFEQQKYHLQKVSRTFALTIPLLDSKRADIIANTYLHLRIIDTVEDVDKVEVAKKVELLNKLSNFYAHDYKNIHKLEQLIQEALELTKNYDNLDERNLIADYLKVHLRSLSYEKSVYLLIFRCASIMSKGMAEFVGGKKILNIQDVDEYCYFVAGVVGEFLAKIFCYEDDKSIKAKELLKLSVSFGEGLQLTNILKDRFKDASREVFFLPYDGSEAQDEKVVDFYTAITLGHLDNAMRFIQLIDKQLIGVRLFCLFNVTMAYATMRRIYFRNKILKISRKEVKILFFMSKLCAKFNFGLKLLQWFLKRQLKVKNINYKELYSRVSKWQNENF